MRIVYFMVREYDVVLACAFEPEEISSSNRDLNEVYEFYEKIGETIENFEKL